ncbi:MAG: hypothetical protein P4L69_17900 [Desulfosporosinus sp.]|nr:hypothetical protein [Desulfosporosinus sp.]
MEKRQACEEQKASHHAKTSDVAAEGKMQLDGPEHWKDDLEKATEEIKDISRSIKSVSDCYGRVKSKTEMMMEIASRFQGQLKSPIQVSGGQKIWTSIMKDYEKLSPKYEVLAKNIKVDPFNYCGNCSNNQHGSGIQGEPKRRH